MALPNSSLNTDDSLRLFAEGAERFAERELSLRPVQNGEEVKGTFSPCRFRPQRKRFWGQYTTDFFISLGEEVRDNPSRLFSAFLKSSSLPLPHCREERGFVNLEVKTLLFPHPLSLPAGRDRTSTIFLPTRPARSSIWEYIRLCSLGLFLAVRRVVAGLTTTLRSPLFDAPLLISHDQPYEKVVNLVREVLALLASQDEDGGAARLMNTIIREQELSNTLLFLAPDSIPRDSFKAFLAEVRKRGGRTSVPSRKWFSLAMRPAPPCDLHTLDHSTMLASLWYLADELPGDEVDLFTPRFQEHANRAWFWKSTRKLAERVGRGGQGCLESPMVYLSDFSQDPLGLEVAHSVAGLTAARQHAHLEGEYRLLHDFEGRFLRSTRALLVRRGWLSGRGGALTPPDDHLLSLILTQLRDGVVINF